MTLYIKTSKDKYELPMFVADSAAELAKMVGLSKGSVASMITRGIGGYHRIVIPEPKKYPNNDGGLWYWDEDGHVVVED